EAAENEESQQILDEREHLNLRCCVFVLICSHSVHVQRHRCNRESRVNGGQLCPECTLLSGWILGRRWGRSICAWLDSGPRSANPLTGNRPVTAQAFLSRAS